MVRRKSEFNCAPVTDRWLLADIWIGFDFHSGNSRRKAAFLFPRTRVLDMRIEFLAVLWMFLQIVNRSKKKKYRTKWGHFAWNAFKAFSIMTVALTFSDCWLMPCHILPWPELGTEIYDGLEQVGRECSPCNAWARACASARYQPRCLIQLSYASPAFCISSQQANTTWYWKDTNYKVILHSKKALKNLCSIQ